ncbi:MAG TPA: Ig-like domain-containing protein [Candidatus Polarisedimenticolaceae bacterium]
MATRTRILTAILFLAAALASPAVAGTYSVAWDPVSDSDLAGYRVYYGASAGSYTQSVDVGNVTQTTLNIADCQMWYVAVKAYDTAGNESASYSNEVSGWARPTVTGISPNAAEQGRTLSVTLTGTNFRAGSTVVFANAGVVVNSVQVNSCSQIVANVTVQPTAAVGTTNVDVEHADGVYGTGVGLFAVQAAVAPTVSSTNPADGATGVAVSVAPTITFSEAVASASINTTTIRLLDDTGAAVAQAAGSPALSANGLTATITPAAALAQNRLYRVQAVGGATGVKDLAGNALATTYTHATGFRTVADTGAPTISAVTATNVAATTARITWTTNEASDSQVFYRTQGTTAWQQTAVYPSMVTSHSVDLQGLAPETVHEYYVRSADAASNASQSGTQTFTTIASPSSYLRFEAEAGTLVAPMRTQTGSGAFNGGWIDTPSGTATGSASSPAGRATYGVNVPTSGTWYLWLRVYAPSTSGDSVFETIDGAARGSVVAPSTGAWVWVAGRSYTLSAGLHTVEVGGQEAQARVDRVLITNDAAFVPTEQPVGDQTAPASVTAFSATPGGGQVTLNWTNPASDYQRTMIRYRTDGAFPVSPVDGFLVTDRAGTAGAGDSFVHGSLSAGTTYSYSAFAIDASGNVATRSTASATPTDVTPPGRVQNARRTDKKPRP